jgi:hypothetical protein
VSDAGDADVVKASLLDREGSGGKPNGFNGFRESLPRLVTILFAAASNGAYGMKCEVFAGCPAREKE